MKSMWLVRAGERAYLINEFKEKQAVAIGWAQLGDIGAVSTLQEMKRLLKVRYSGYKEPFL